MYLSTKVDVVMNKALEVRLPPNFFYESDYLPRP